MTKIKDLIELPPVKTVIELATVRDASTEDVEQLLQLVETFVVTEDIERCLRVIFDQISNQPDAGAGCFLTGNFGSGKSHLLAVLSLVLQHSWAWAPIIAQCEHIGSPLQEYESKISGRKFLIVQIPLLEYRTSETLEYIVWQSVESTFARQQIFITLAPDSSFLEGFEKYVLPAHRKEIDVFLESKLPDSKSLSEKRVDAVPDCTPKSGTSATLESKLPGSQWDILYQESQEDALSLAQEYLKTTGQNIPFKLELDRQQAWEKLSVSLNTYNFDGVVFLIDELSEFLRSKPDTHSLNEDTRFLQFLGEKSAHAPVWIIAALQEAIEKTGDISQTIFNKIKDRYQRRLELSTKHIRELIDRRLISKKGDEAVEMIREAYGKLKRSFAHLKISEDEFLQIYPIHPETLELLDVNTRFFSQRRGVVDFIYHQVKGDANRQIEGMLERDYTELLTPDKIFDHFALRIREQIDLNPYYQIYKDYFERQIPRVFEDEQDREYALRLIKILILLRLSPVEYTRTVRELADMLMYNLMDFGGELNYEYIGEQILSKLLRECSYIRVERGETPLSDTYYIDLKSNVIEQIQAKQRDIVASLADDDGRILNAIFENITSSAIPFANLQNTYSERKNIIWENTPRQGWVKLCNLLELSISELEKVLADLKETEGDFVVYITTPFNVAAQLKHFQEMLAIPSDRFVDGVLCWIPKQLNDMPETVVQILKDFYAQKQLYAEYQNDETQSGIEVREVLKENLQLCFEKAKRLIEDAYFSGSIHSISGEIQLDLLECRLQNFSDTLAKLIQNPLLKLYPQHIPPHQELTSLRLVGELVDEFVRPGSLERGTKSPKYLQTAVETIAVCFGIAEKHRQRYELDFDLTAPLLAHIFDLLPTESGDGRPNFVEYNWLYSKLRKSEYGTPSMIIDLLLLALIRKGYAIAYHSGNRLNPEHLPLPLAKSCTHVGRGELIEDKYRAQLEEVSLLFLREPLASYDVGIQEELWVRLCNAKDELSRDLRATQKRVKNVAKQIGESDNEGLTEALSQISHVQSLLAEINPAYGSKEGLEHFLDVEPQLKSGVRDEGISSLMEKANAAKSFATEQADALLSIHNYLSNPHLIIPDSPEYSELNALKERVNVELKVDEELVFGGRMLKIENAFRQFKNAYSDRYIAEHDSANATGVLENVSNSTEYALLFQLSSISLISVSNDISTIQNLINAQLHNICMRLTRETLNQFPVCPCGYKLGTMSKPLQSSELSEMMQKGIRQYLTSLQETPYRDQLKDYISNIQQLEQTFPETELMTLLALNIALPTDELLAQLTQLLTLETTEHINNALEGGIRIVSRDISELSKELVGRKYPKAKVLEIMNQWLDGEEDLTGDVYVAVK